MLSTDVSSRAVFSGVPSFFRACCFDASRGGSLGYDHSGRELARHVHGLVPYAVEYDEWGSRVAKLEQLADEGDERAVLKWFVANFPNCLALIPRRRRRAFLRGALEMLTEDRGEL